MSNFLFKVLYFALLHIKRPLDFYVFIETLIMQKCEKMQPGFKNILTASIVHVCMTAKVKKKILEKLKIKTWMYIYIHI